MTQGGSSAPAIGPPPSRSVGCSRASNRSSEVIGRVLPASVYESLVCLRETGSYCGEPFPPRLPAVSVVSSPSPADTGADESAKADTQTSGEAPTENDSQTSREGKGHGRNGADAYTGAEKIEARHESLVPGDPCPKYEDGTLYDTGGRDERCCPQAAQGAGQTDESPTD
ncbi:MAG: hypothetical protein A2V70_12930 [Planctomycetes bacterium RBG_13_63_9]|nr:MAG: hypothetical protein A2V70_12930 [Planctomycetes bacterium RBG_13_63_9]